MRRVKQKRCYFGQMSKIWKQGKTTVNQPVHMLMEEIEQRQMNPVAHSKHKGDRVGSNPDQK